MIILESEVFPLKFTLKKYIKSSLLQYLLLLTFLIFFFFLTVTLIDNNIYKVITIAILVIIFTTLILSSFYRISSINSYSKKNDTQKLSKLQKELNNSLLSYGDWFLTEEYIFLLYNQRFIEYSDIILIDSSIKIKPWYNNVFKFFSYQTKIYLKNGEHYTFKTTLDDKEFTNNFINIIKHRNLDIFIGKKSEFKNQIKEIYNIEI